MCSVVGYVGNSLSRSYVIDGLTRLEYRGYDSAGFACLHPEEKKIVYAKCQGGISNLIKNFESSPIDGHIGIGHTRWSTHGIASTENAHPQFDCSKKIAIVHNGIIENHKELRERLDKSHIFLSQTDTEVVVHLLEELLQTHKSIKNAIQELVATLNGAYAIVCMLQEYPDTLVAIRKRSPLCLGIGEDEIFVASDLLAFIGNSNKVIYLPDESFTIIKKNSFETYDFAGNRLKVEPEISNISWTNTAKCGFEHYMLKEIYEQKRVIQNTVAHYRSISDSIWSQIKLSSQEIRDLDTLNFIACGTSYHAGKISEFFFEEICNIKSQSSLASEFRYKKFFSAKNSAYIFISQSGETADTLEAVRFVNKFKMDTIALANVISSSIVRECNGYLTTHAGQEIAVASTKAFTAQVSALYWLANRIALEKGLIDQQKMEEAEEELLIVSEILENCIEVYKKDILNLALKYSNYKNAIFLGREISYPFAMEASLKLKEISYIFTDCYPAGELKHGSLAVVDAQTPCFIFSTLDEIVYQKIVSNAQEIKARSGHVVAFAFEGQQELIQLADTVFVFPKVSKLLGPLSMTGVMQYFIYQIANVLKRPIDKPRNLAKSVTVE